jgi:hypothetical protein
MNKTTHDVKVIFYYNDDMLVLVYEYNVDWKKLAK